MKARAICNPASSGGGYDPTELRREIEGYELEWVTTQSPGDAREAAKEWRGGLLVVVGGDGTISEVVNGLGQAGFPAGVTLAILPAETGNDLAATLALLLAFLKSETCGQSPGTRTFRGPLYETSAGSCSWCLGWPRFET